MEKLNKGFIMTTIITYEQMKNFYEEFKKNLPEDEFNRYYKEFSYMKNLIKLAQKENKKKDIEEYKKIQKKDIEELKKLGYKFK